MRAGRGHGMGPVQRVVVRAVCGWKSELKGVWPTPQPKILIGPRQGNPQVGPSPSQPTQFFRPKRGWKDQERKRWEAYNGRGEAFLPGPDADLPASSTQSMWGLP